MQLIFNFLWQNKVVFYVVLALGCLVAFLPSEAGMQPRLNDKLMHMISFFVMAGLCHIAHPNTAYWRQILGLALVGMGIEFVQAVLPYRAFSVWDWVANMVGIVVYFSMLANAVIPFLRDKFELD